MHRLLTAATGTALAATMMAMPALAAKKVPYWASINVGEAMMRAGPGRNFPAEWLYKRRGLPVKVVQIYVDKRAHAEWRKVQDPDGAEGWMQANLLSETRTGLVTGDIRPLREKPDAQAAVVWRAEPGVVGKVTQCTGGWCNLDVGGKKGFVEVAHLFGVAADETLP
ncbi:MAG: SH3 domain-containing protein [Pseudomonadota bacterium]